MGTHGLGDFLPPWSPLLPSQAKQTHVYTLKSTHVHITLVLGKATDIRCLSSLRKHHHQVNAPKLLTRSTEGKRRRENVVTIWDWIQTCTFFMSGFLLNTKNGACETVPAHRSWHETRLTKTWGKRIPAFFCSVNLRQTFKKTLNWLSKEWSSEGKSDISDINRPSRICSRNPTSVAFSTGTEVKQSVGFHARRAFAGVLKKMYKVHNGPLPPTMRFL